MPILQLCQRRGLLRTQRCMDKTQYDMEIPQMQEKELLQWFSDYSLAWRKVLQESDQNLGLALEGGKEGGYRSKKFLPISMYPSKSKK